MEQRKSKSTKKEKAESSTEANAAGEMLISTTNLIRGMRDNCTPEFA